MKNITTVYITKYNQVSLINGPKKVITLLPRIYEPPIYKSRRLYPGIGACAYKWGDIFQKGKWVLL